MLSPEDVTPSRDDLEVIGCFNPGAVEINGCVHLLIRVAERPREKREGLVGLPFMRPGRGIAFDWVPQKNIRRLDNRIVETRADGRIRLTSLSHLRLATSGDGFHIDTLSERPTLIPMDELDIYGVEDARITPLGDEFLITYVGVSPHGIVTKLLATKDFKEFRKIGTVFTTENKDVVLFPDRVNGLYSAFHRPLSQAPLGPPEIWLASSKDLRYWGDHRPVLTAGKGWASLKIGAGCPPLRTKRGWLEIFHGVQRRSSSDRVGKYCGGAALFDLDDPAKLLGVSPLPFLVPEKDFEREGFLPDIIFPSGAVLRENCLLVYYGAADCRTAVAEFSLNEVLDGIQIQ